MKKLLLALVITLSFTSFIAQAETDVLQAANMLQKAPANPLIQQLTGKCDAKCANNFLSCINDPTGPGWVYCEIFFERCMTDCGY